MAKQPAVNYQEAEETIQPPAAPATVVEEDQDDLIMAPDLGGSRYKGQEQVWYKKVVSHLNNVINDFLMFCTCWSLFT